MDKLNENAAAAAVQYLYWNNIAVIVIYSQIQFSNAVKDRHIEGSIQFGMKSFEEYIR